TETATDAHSAASPSRASWTISGLGDCVIGAAPRFKHPSARLDKTDGELGLSEIEARPGVPPVVASRDERQRPGLLDVPAVPVLDEAVGRREHDLAGRAGIVRLHGRQVGERTLRAVLDRLARLLRRQGTCAVAAEPDLYLDRRQPVAEQLLRLAAGRAVAGHEQDRTAPPAAERRVDAGLADERAVEPEALPRLARDGVRHHAVRRPRHRVHADEERRVAAVLEKRRVLRPFVLDDELAVGMEEL